MKYALFCSVACFVHFDFTLTCGGWSQTHTHPGLPACCDCRYPARLVQVDRSTCWSCRLLTPASLSSSLPGLRFQPKWTDAVQTGSRTRPRRCSHGLQVRTHWLIWVAHLSRAPIQITAEQLLREAQERSEAPHTAPRQRVEDFEELNEFRGRKRREFEEVIRRTRSNIAAWIKYAYWEASQGEYDRSRSVYERALDVDPTDVKLWLSYSEMVRICVFPL